MKILGDLLEELRDELPGLMFQYHYNSQGSDYICMFCLRRPESGDSELVHTEKCLGKRLETYFAEASRAGEG